MDYDELTEDELYILRYYQNINVIKDSHKDVVNSLLQKGLLCTIGRLNGRIYVSVTRDGHKVIRSARREQMINNFIKRIAALIDDEDS